MTPVFPTEADRHRHLASVCGREAEARRITQPTFADELDLWAARAQARALAAERGGQADLFGAGR